MPLVLGTAAAFCGIFVVQANLVIGRFEPIFLVMPAIVGGAFGGLLAHIVTLKRRLQREHDELRASTDREERYAAAVSGGDFTVWDWRSGESLIFRTNPVILHGDTGHGPDHMTHEWWIEKIHPEDRVHYLQCLDDHFAGRTERYVCEYRARRQDGSYCWLQDRGIAERDENGNAVRLSGTSADVTERVLAEQALRDSEARLAGIVTLAPEAVISMDADLNITVFNQGAEQVFGYPAAEAIGRPIDALIPLRFQADFRAKTDDLVAVQGRQAQNKRALQIEGLRKDGSEFPAEVSVSRLQVADEVIFTAMFHDITERREAVAAIMAAKEEAELANRAKSEFLANMSHELRTPLNAVLGFSEVMLLEGFGPLGSDRYREYASDIHDSGSHLLSIINDVLDICRVEAGGMELIEEVVDLRQTADFAMRLLHPKARAKGLKVEVELEPQASVIFADSRSLKQILLNLMSNSVKFTRDGGLIRVTSGLQQDGGIVIRVEDTGIGIAAADIPKVLAPFGQVASSATRDHEGTGLGLSLARKLTELHGGELRLQSEVGRGTTVSVYLPASRVRGAAEAARNSAA